MEAELKSKWVEALRSGKYEQGRASLRSGGKYCCLGVLCAVAGLEISTDGENVDGGYGPITELGVRTDTLWWMNDQEKKSFTEIADYIEKNL